MKKIIIYGALAVVGWWCLLWLVGAGAYVLIHPAEKVYYEKRKVEGVLI